jgi:hypothetical protein
MAVVPPEERAAERPAGLARCASEANATTESGAKQRSQAQRLRGSS